MQQSLNALSTSRDYESKKVHLEGLKNRLEALASPYVVEALTKKNLEQSKKFVKIFEDMGRFQLFVKYYSKCQKAGLVQKWQETVDLDTDDNFLEVFQSYYDFLVGNWQDQVKWCEEVIPNISSVGFLIEFYSDLLNTLTPEFSSRFEENLKRVDDPITWLISAKSCSNNFAMNIKSKIGTIVVDEKSLQALAKSLYQPYVVPISKLEITFKTFYRPITTSLLKIEDVTETVQVLGLNTSKVFAYLSDGRKKCLNLTEGCSFPAFISASEWFLKSYLELYRVILKQIKEIGTADFSSFQMGISVLQSLGEFQNNLKQFELETIEMILNAGSNLKKQDEPFINYLALFLDSSGNKEFATLLITVSNSTEPAIFKNSLTFLEKICKDVYQTCFLSIFTPVSSLLEAVPNAPAWKTKTLTSDLPDYSYAPQEYITQIGQYLMHLPQLLEPFMTLENPSLNIALTIAGGDYPVGEDGENIGFVELFLGRVADATCRAYCDQILTIGSVGAPACKQLATDINYLGNVLDDLGLSLSDKLKSVALLIKLTPAEYGTGSVGCSPQLVAAVRQMRNIVSE